MNGYKPLVCKGCGAEAVSLVAYLCRVCRTGSTFEEAVRRVTAVTERIMDAIDRNAGVRLTAAECRMIVRYLPTDDENAP